MHFMFTSNYAMLSRNPLKRCCICVNAFYTSNASSPLSAKEIIEKQLRAEVKIPKAKKWSKTAVLEALDGTVQFSLQPEYSSSVSPQYWGRTNVGSFKSRARKSGIMAANYVISKQKALFEHDWEAEGVRMWLEKNPDEEFSHDPLDGDGNISMLDESKTEDKRKTIFEEEELFKEIHGTSLEVSVESLKTLLRQQKAEKAANMFLSLRKNDTEIPEQLVNQLIGFLSFCHCCDDTIEVYKKFPHEMMFRVSKSGNIELLDKVMNALPFPSPEHIMAYITSCTKAKQFEKAVSIYSKYFQDKTIADLKTYNAMTLVSRNHGKTWLETIYRNGFWPNEETFIFLFMASNTWSPQKHFKIWSKILNELKVAGIDESLSMYGAMMYRVGGFKLEKEAIDQMNLCIVKNMRGKKFKSTPREVAALDFLQYKLNDIKSIKILWEVITSYDNYKLVQISNMEYRFLKKMLICSLKYDSMENAWSMLHKLTPRKFSFNSNGKMELLSAILRHNRPEYLPATFSLYLDRMRNESSLCLEWLKIAMELSCNADKDTITELVHIVMKFGFYVLTSDDKSEKIMLLNLSLQFIVTFGSIAHASEHVKMCLNKFGEIPINKQSLELCRKLHEQHPDSSTLQNAVEGLEEKWKSFIPKTKEKSFQRNVDPFPF